MNRDRPRLIGVLFWGCAGSSAVLQALMWQVPVPARLASAATLVLLALLWPALRWRRGTGRWPVTTVFLLLSVLGGSVDGSNVSLFLLLIALTNVTLAFGPRAGALTTAALVVAQFAGQLWLGHRTPLWAAYETFAIALYGVFVMTLATAVNEARAARDRADRLHDELAEAHRDLRGYAERAHELAVAEERVRMARELHDSVGHHLTVVKVGLENAERWRDREPDAAWQDVHQAKTLTGDALQEIRRVVRALRPSQLDGRRGSDALRDLAGSFRGTGLDVEITVDGAERPLGPVRETVLFRALQESLTNALRHSGGTRIEVRLGFAPDAARLTVTDDGHGAAGAPHGFGLTSLAARVHDAGGTLTTTDPASGGFRVRIDLPDPPPHRSAALPRPVPGAAVPPGAGDAVPRRGLGTATRLGAGDAVPRRGACDEATPA
ncbi:MULTISPECIES: sensor histidine kinase [Catenuloplanes]|uniref:histidine kinase n=1 Tax=Catenuloplanes niger TaxID=587534 RepID=A0AAE3ZJG5_9ACTN|nr:sensor histidine kinase [Catenuloplanes niger]MDR7320281.1 signal transduction histidine kinase [Catenuloplanes niger]